MRDRLGSKIKLISGQHIEAVNTNSEGLGIPYLTGPADFIDKKIFATKFTEWPKICCDRDDILITVKGSGTGSIAIADKKYCISRQLMAIRCESIDPIFTQYLIERNEQKFNSSAAGMIPGISRIDVLKLKVPQIQLSEQKALADVLSTWDKAIEKTERLIQAKERQKLGELHSRISSQKANSTIGAFAKPVVRKVDKPEESYVAVGIRSHFKGTFQRLVEDPRTVNMDSLYRVKENDLILNITFAWEGAIALVKKEDEECYVSHRFPTYEIKRSKAEPCFIRQLIMSSRMKYDLSNISPGGAGRNRVLNKKDFLKMPIWLPDLETQKNIGEYLGAIDKEIDLLKKLADKYKTQKRGLMQKMLTGEWRVKPEIVNQYMEA